MQNKKPPVHRSETSTTNAQERLDALLAGLSNMAVDALYPSQEGIAIAQRYAAGALSHEQAFARVLQLHGIGPY